MGLRFRWFWNDNRGLLCGLAVVPVVLGAAAVGRLTAPDPAPTVLASAPTTQIVAPVAPQQTPVVTDPTPDPEVATPSPAETVVPKVLAAPSAAATPPAAQEPAVSTAPAVVASALTQGLTVTGTLSAAFLLRADLAAGTDTSTCWSLADKRVEVRDGSGAVLALAEIDDGQLLERKADQLLVDRKCQWTYSVASLPSAPVYVFAVVPKAPGSEDDAAETVSASSLASGAGPELSWVDSVY